MTGAGHSLLTGAFGSLLLQLAPELFDPVTFVVGPQLRTGHLINVIQFLFEMFKYYLKLFLQLLTNTVGPLPLLLNRSLQAVVLLHLLFCFLLLTFLVLRFLTLLLGCG